MTRNLAMPQHRSPLRAVAALVTVGAVFIGSPVGLVHVAAARFGSNSPLDGLNAPWRWTLRDAKTWGRYLTNGFASTHQLVDLLYRAALITLWVCLAVLAYTIITETVFQLRHGMPSSPRSNPLGQLGRIIATMLVAVLPISSTASPASASPLPVQRTPITQSSSPGRRIPPPPASDTHRARASTAAAATALAPAWQIHVVQPSESVLSIAQRYGNGRDSASVAQQIVDANIGRTVADGQTFKTAALIEPGWKLRVPATSTTPTISSPAIDTAAADPSMPVSAAETVTVSPGDSYWREAEHHLSQDTPPGQVADYTRQLIRDNAPRLGYDNPKMLHPGDTLYITPTTPTTPPATPVSTDPVTDPATVNSPAPPAAPATPIPPPIDTAVTVTPEAADAAPSTGRARDQIGTATDVDAPATGRARDQVDTPTTTPASLEPTIATAATGSVPVTFPAPAGSPATIPEQSPVVESIDDGRDVGSHSPWLEVTYGSLLAAGIVAAAARLRRRRGAQLAPGTRPVDPPDAAIGAESVLATGGPLHRISTLTQLMRTLTPYAREETDPPLVRAVQFDHDTVEVLFTRQALVAPAGWEPVNGGQSWLHRLEPNRAETTTTATAEGAVAHLVTPSLVTIGHVGERQVLLDLDTAGSIALTGDRTSAEGVARSMLFELASQPLGHWADVIPCGVSVDGLEHLDGVWAPMSVERAVRHVRSCISARAEYGAPSVVAARSDTATDTGMWNSVVVVIDATSTDPVRLEELLSLCEPGSGYVTVVIGDHHTARERLHLVDDRTAVWQSTTLTTTTQRPNVPQVMTPPVVTHEAASHVAVLLDHAAAGDIIDTFTNPTTTDPSPIHVARADDGSLQYVEADYDVLLRTFGVVELTSVTPEVQVDLTPKQTELVALIATHRDTPINADVVVSLLSDYGQKTRDDKPMPVESLSRRISEARTRLGDDRDGNPFLPYSPTGRGAAGRYQLSPRLKTDYELLTDRYHAARSLPSTDALAVLRDGLALLTGPPLRARNLYQWAAPSGATTRILSIVHGYLGALLELANTHHDATTAHVVLSVLALVTDDPMLELPLAKRVEQFETVTPDDTLRAALRDWRARLIADIHATDPLSEAI